MKRLAMLATLGAVGVLASACLFDAPQASAPAPVIVTNNVPAASDGGAMVLLAIAGMAAFVLLAIASVASMAWLSERRRRVAAETAVVAITGAPVSQLSLAMAAPVSTERLHAIASGSRS